MCEEDTIIAVALAAMTETNIANAHTKGIRSRSRKAAGGEWKLLN
jgi:hypothetical protein